MQSILAPEHVVAQAGSDASTMTIEGVIAELTSHSDLDDGGMAILAAATTLRDSTGRGRKDALHKMCRAWDVDRQEKIDGKWKNRALPVIEALLIESVCSAAVRWQRIHDGDDASPARRGQAHL